MPMRVLVTQPAERRERPRRHWRFWLPLALQVLIVLAVPAPKLAAYAWGTPVVLAVAPVDPYDLLRGRYVELGYELDRPSLLQSLPGWQGDWAHGEHEVFVTLVPGKANEAWRAVAIADTLPETLPEGAVALKGQLKSGQADWGLGQYYMGEAIGDEAEAGLQRAPSSARAEVRVDGRGQAVLVGLWIAGKRY